MIVPCLLLAQSETIEFTSSDWDMSRAKTVTHLGREALAGTAILRDVEFENGIIEVDIAVDGNRSYPGILFRRTDARNYEHVYIRPHREDLYPDAVQYAPTSNGISSWQLYYGEGFTGGTSIPADTWLHLRIEVSGTQARVFLSEGDKPGSGNKPILTIHDLKHGSAEGAIGVTGPIDGSAYFSNFLYSTEELPEFAPPPVKWPSPGVLRDWKLSKPFRSGDIDFEKTPGQQGLPDLDWQDITTAEASGLVDIALYHGRQGAETDCVWARTIIDSENERTLELQFGYSDAVAVFLGGRLLYSGSSPYRGRDPSALGIVGYNDAVYLPLVAGENELLLLVAESFGGWGFMCRDGDAEFVHAALSPAWDIRKGLRYPESVVYDRERNRLYVSNLFNAKQEFIARIHPDGTVDSLQWVTGLRMPTGQWLHGETLYAVDRSGVVEIDVDSGNVVKVHPVADARFLNDITADEQGNIYLSDSRADVIHLLRDGKSEVWLQGSEIDDPNSLHVHEGELLVGNSGDGSLKAVSLADKSVRTVAVIGKGAIIDGIYPLGQDRYLVSDFRGRVFFVGGEGKTVLLLDRTTAKRFCADFEYIPERGLLIIPSLYENSLTAYKVDFSKIE